jgi:hypothetical protein
LIQHIKDAQTLSSALRSNNNNSILKRLLQPHKNDFIDQHLLYILYQVYMPLAMNAETFTHYDLHMGNVLIYEPVKEKYIQYHYHVDATSTVSFKCCYIAKIIDYGRSYFTDPYKHPYDPTQSSQTIYAKICKTTECDGEEEEEEEDCGFEYGYGTLKTERKPGRDAFIDSKKRNVSHDLRLLSLISQEIRNKIGLKQQLQYGIGVKKTKDKHFGTIEIEKSGRAGYRIYNVRDAHEALREIISNPDSHASNDRYFLNKRKLGDLHIYTDGRPMEFIQAA